MSSSVAVSKQTRMEKVCSFEIFLIRSSCVLRKLPPDLSDTAAAGSAAAGAAAPAPAACSSSG